MENLFYNIGQVLGITIIHSLWQGLLIYLVIRLLFIAFPSVSAGKKHNALYIALTSMALWFACTFFVEAKAYSWTVNSFSTTTQAGSLTVIDVAKIPQTMSQHPAFLNNYRSLVKTYLPYISLLYIISLLINLGRLTMAWQNIRAIKKIPATDGKLQQQVNEQLGRLGLIKQVQLSVSELVNVPCVIGYLKPVLLLPVTITTQLSAEEIEDILLHELAHVKNNDYLLNLIQQVMTMLLFLNPFALLLSRMINRERENRCDDMVLQLTGNPLVYAHALVKLEKARQHNLQLALAATGTKYHLFARIERIMKTNKPVVNIRHLVLAMLLFIGSLGSLAWLNPEIKGGKLVSERGARAISQLTAIVKSAVNKTDDNKPPAHQTITVKKADTAKTGVASAAKDTILTDDERSILLKQYQQVEKELHMDMDIMDNSPESIQVRAARKTLDSVSKIAPKPTLTADLIQEDKEKKKIFQDFLNSPGWKQKQAYVQSLTSKFSLLIYKQPEMEAIRKEFERKRDSIANELKGLSKEELDKSTAFKKLFQDENIQESIIRMKLLKMPEIKAASDSAETARHNLYTSPEFIAINKATRASDGFMAAMEPVSLDAYKKVLKEATEKLSNTDAWKKMNADIKRSNELANKLYGRKPNKP